LVKKYGTGSSRAKFQGELTEGLIASERVLLLTPLTFMNLSGASVQAARDFYKVEQQDLLVVCDDFNLPLARLRFRAKGSSGGQKGLEDIIRRLGTDEFPRLRLGVGAPPPGRDVAAYVLSKFTKEEQPEIQATTSRSVEAVAAWATRGIEHCMNHYNA